MIAWEQTEMDFNRQYVQEGMVMHRYTTYDSFRDAFSKFQSGQMPAYIKVHILLVGDL